MKSFLLFVAFLCCTAVYSQNSKLVVSCCESKESKNFGRCSGTASCTACSNCSSCKHCSKEGGSCGVCASYAAPVKTYSPKQAAAPKQGIASTTAKKPQYKRLQMLEVTSPTLNVRIGPGPDYDVIETIEKGASVTYVSSDGEWLYIRVNDSGTNGWVNFKYVK